MAVLTSLVMLSGLAYAESPGTLPKGSEVVYAGAGVTTFSQLDQGGGSTDRDRELRTRADLYGSMGVTERFQLSASIPLVYSTVVDRGADIWPCPEFLPGEGYCESYVTAGQARLDARYGVAQDKTKVTLGLAADVDSWNAGRRGQYNSAGSGRSMVEAFVVAGRKVSAGEWRLRGLALAGFGYSIAPDATSADGIVTVKAPGDQVRGSLELRAKAPGPLAFELGAHGLQRLSGVPIDDGNWVGDWFFSSQDRWNVLQYSHIAGSAKVSIDLPKNNGLHIGASRVLAVANGPSDLWDMSLGWHHYFAP